MRPEGDGYGGSGCAEDPDGAAPAQVVDPVLEVCYVL